MVRRSPRFDLTIALVLLAFGTSATDAATLRVAANGLDSPTCGPQADPCRSINQAIENGDEGDKILVGPGRYAEATEGTECGGSCLIEIDRKRTLVSTHGAGVTVIDGEFSVTNVIRVQGTADGTTIQGFTVTRGNEDGIRANGDDLAMLDNRVVNNDEDGLDLEGGVDRVLSRNIVIDNSADGIETDGGTVTHNLAMVNNSGIDMDDRNTAREIWRNAALCNTGTGIDIDTTMDKVTQNAATGNGGFGVCVNDPDTLVRETTAVGNTEGGFEIESISERTTLLGVAAIGNIGPGVVVRAVDTTIERSDLFGNDDDNGNCGVLVDGAVVMAEVNFWGDADGPGPNPADDVCEPDGIIDADPSSVAIYTAPFAVLPF